MEKIGSSKVAVEDYNNHIIPLYKQQKYKKYFRDHKHHMVTVKDKNAINHTIYKIVVTPRSKRKSIDESDDTSESGAETIDKFLKDGDKENYDDDNIMDDDDDFDVDHLLREYADDIEKEVDLTLYLLLLYYNMVFIENTIAYSKIACLIAGSSRAIVAFCSYYNLMKTPRTLLEL